MSRDAISLDLADACFVKLPTTRHEGARTQLAAGDVLVSITADIGIISYVDNSVPLPAFINQHIALGSVSAALRDSIRAMGADPMIPPRKHRLDVIEIDWHSDKDRHWVETMLSENKTVQTRGEAL